MGIRAALKHIRRFGFPESALPRDPSLALGSGGAAPWDIASGYAVFANGGFRVQRYLIDRVVDSSGQTVYSASAPYVCPDCSPPRQPDPPAEAPVETADTGFEAPGETTAEPAMIWPEGEVPAYIGAADMIEHASKWRPEPDETPGFLSNAGYAPRIITPQNAYLIYDMMRDVIRRGTGRRARELGRRDLAGKTGTSNERRDAWFSGFNADLVATAWVGFDQERSLGAREEGSRTALPIWKYFMADALAGSPDATIPRPPGLVTVRIDPQTGRLAPAGYPGAIFEIFREDHVPTERVEELDNPTTAQPLPQQPEEDIDIF